MNHRILLLAGLAGLALSGQAAPALAQNLALSSWLPPRHPIVVNAIRPWAEEVEEVTEGRVAIRILGRPLGAPPAHFDLARDGVADITYGLHSFSQDDRFIKSEVGQFTFIGDDAVESSKAFYTVYTEDLGAEDEHSGAKLLGLFVHGPGVLHNNRRKIESADDFSGLRIRVPGGYVGNLMQSLGATPSFISSTEVYEQLSRGVIDGAAFTYEALTAFNLTPYVRHSMTVPGGLYNTTWFLVMNQSAWDSISEEDQEAIEAISGLHFAERVGTAWNDADEAAIAELEAAGIDIHEANDAVLGAVRQAAEAQEQAWVARVGDGYDAEAALERLRGMTGVELE
jgi:TRAP-type C4-dicarboxylate transport system substrate-binding protein